MKKIIHKLRQQPEDVRKNILHILTATFGLILILLWIYSLGVHFSNQDTKQVIKNNLEPVSGLKANVFDNNSLPEQPIILGQ